MWYVYERRFVLTQKTHSHTYIAHLPLSSGVCLFAHNLTPYTNTLWGARKLCLSRNRDLALINSFTRYLMSCTHRTFLAVYHFSYTTTFFCRAQYLLLYTHFQWAMMFIARRPLVISDMFYILLDWQSWRFVSVVAKNLFTATKFGNCRALLNVNYVSHLYELLARCDDLCTLLLGI